MTQEDLARAADMSVSAVSKLEQREMDPSWSTVVRLAKALGVNTLAFEEEAPSPTGQKADADRAAAAEEVKPPAPKRRKKSR